ncbi:MAG: DUF2493 domain-containing protein [Clostridia bacterium]|nr:DUF2493 domain-containing protein [Clostridia bacterium]
MKVAVIGSREIRIENLQDYLPQDTTEIVSGGAKGVDTCAKEYALAHGIPLTEFRPEYSRYGRGAPLKRNLSIIEYADMVLAFWDGKSKGTGFVIEACKKRNIPILVYKIPQTVPPLP